jgi:hypothetical protein
MTVKVSASKNSEKILNNMRLVRNGIRKLTILTCESVLARPLMTPPSPEHRAELSEDWHPPLCISEAGFLKICGD